MFQNLSNLRQWKCEHGHTLGVVQRVEVKEGSCTRWVTRLLLFRQAIDIEEAAEPDVIASLEGTALDICCSIPGCGEKRSWFMGEDALLMLLEKRKVRT